MAAGPLAGGTHRRFEQIDVLRGLAALCVLASHYTSYSLDTLGSTPIHVPREYGFYAVKLFFVISGFVIYMTLNRSRSALDFAFSRFARLYPAYGVSLTIVVALGVAFFGEKMWWGGYLVNATMLQAFLGFKDLDNVYWSLAVEIAFYFQMAWLLAFGLLHRIEAIGTGWMLAACAWFAAKRHLAPGLPDLLERVFLLEYVALFVAGMMFYRGLHDGMTPRRKAILLLALLCEGFIGGGLSALVVAGAAFGVFMLAATGRLAFAVNRVTLWLGAISYSLYITHRNLGYAVLYQLHGAGVPVPLALLLTLCMALAVASALRAWVEVPAERGLRRWYDRRFGRIGVA